MNPPLASKMQELKNQSVPNVIEHHVLGEPDQSITMITMT
jgi:hypothetical protein